ncbi:MAG: ArsR/SmtB family transcription factor [Thiohalomonadales bacterium]
MAIYNSATLDRTFHALGDESRRRILATISHRGHCSAGELVNLFDCSQPTVSKHLRVMEKAGLLHRSIEGRQHIFSLKTESLKEADSWLQRHLDFWQNSLDQLTRYLDANAENEQEK